MSQTTSDIYHYENLDHWGPVSAQKMNSLLDLIAIDSGAKVLDIGCGKAELLIGLVERTGACALGLDHSPFALERARAAAAERLPEADIVFTQQEIADFDPGQASFDAISWIGGPYIGDDFPSTLKALSGWLRPGGFLLIGHGFWASQPHEDYLAATGISAGEFVSHADNIELGQATDLRLLYCCTSTRDEWDHFECSILYNVEMYAAEHPDAPDPQGRLERRRSWHLAQQRWGRDAMGFGLYLFRK